MADDKVKVSELSVKTVGDTTTLVGLDEGDSTCSRYDITNIPVAQTVATQTITGDQTIQGTTYANDIETDSLKLSTDPSDGKFLQSDASGNATWEYDNSIYKPGYTKYCVDGRDDLATVIASITNENTVVNISQGTFEGATPLVIDKNSIDLIAPAATPAAVEFKYPISTATSADRISMRYLSFDSNFTAGSKRSTYNHCTFNENLSILASDTAGYMSFVNCEFAAGKTVSVAAGFADILYFVNCNFESVSAFSLLQPLAAQVIFTNCSGFVSFPANATYAGINVLNTGFIQSSITKTLLFTGAGAAGQVVTSNGAGNPDTWETPTTGSGDVVGPASSVNSEIAAFDGTTGKLLKESGISINNLVTLDSTGTFTGKTIAEGDNTITLSLGTLSDVNPTAPTNGQTLKWDGTAEIWTPADDNAGTGTVTSVGITSTDLTVSGGPITESGNIGLAVNNGLDAAKLADGSVSNLQFQHVSGATSNIQDQINAIPGGGDSTYRQFVTPGTVYDTVPVGSTTVLITANGSGGGSGGGGASNAESGNGGIDSYHAGGSSGGASGLFDSITVQVTEGQRFEIVIPAGGLGGTAQTNRNGAPPGDAPSDGFGGGQATIKFEGDPGTAANPSGYLLQVGGGTGGFAPIYDGSGAGAPMGSFSRGATGTNGEMASGGGGGGYYENSGFHPSPAEFGGIGTKSDGANGVDSGSGNGGRNNAGRTQAALNRGYGSPGGGPTSPDLSSIGYGAGAPGVDGAFSTTGFVAGTAGNDAPPGIVTITYFKN
jgi:hypothetical protein